MLVLYGIKLAAMDIPSWEISSSLMHLPMLPLHEFGHILFRPFGEFMMLLGDLGLLARAQSVGYVVHRFGVAMLIVSFMWAAWIVWRQYRRSSFESTGLG